LTQVKECNKETRATSNTSGFVLVLPLPGFMTSGKSLTLPKSSTNQRELNQILSSKNSMFYMLFKE
jgi:hypothetical protein